MVKQAVRNSYRFSFMCAEFSVLCSEISLSAFLVIQAGSRILIRTVHKIFFLLIFVQVKFISPIHNSQIGINKKTSMSALPTATA